MASGDYSLAEGYGLLIVLASPMAELGVYSSGSVVAPLRLKSCGAQASRQAGSSHIRDQTHVPLHWQADS